MTGSGDSSDELTRKRPTVRREIAREPSHVGSNVQNAAVMEPYQAMRPQSSPPTQQIRLPTDPPSRLVLRIAGIFTQLACAICLLLGTIAFVLVQQNRSGGMEYAITWGVASLLAIVLGGLMARGALVTVIGSALLDAAFGITLIAIDYDTLRGILRVLPTSDVDMIADIITGLGIALTVIAALALASIPQAVRYVRWVRLANDPSSGTAAASTARGFPPPPVAAARGSMWQIPTTAPDETRGRRRMYFALAGFAIGFGAGIGVLMSSSNKQPTIAAVEPVDKPGRKDGNGSSNKVVLVTPPEKDPTNPPVVPSVEIEDHITAQHAAIAAGKYDALAQTYWPKAVGFGPDADGLAEGRDAILTKLATELGQGGPVVSRSRSLGTEGNHTWIAEELEVGNTRYAITQLAAFVGGKWMTVAVHWAIPIPDSKAERMEILHTLRKPKPVTNVVEGPKDLEPQIRTAFGSRAGNNEARSARSSGFNFGSAPGERVVGGSRIKSVFGKLRSEIVLHDGIRAMAAGAWDPAQQAAPTVAFALLNANFLTKSKAATDLTHTFRVLVILVKEGADWKIVSSQWSHGGPF